MLYSPTHALALARKAFSDRKAFAAARSTRADAFNFGSAAEHMPNGASIKKVFAGLTPR